MSIIIFFIILLVLVIVHESGHFFMAKAFGIRVDEFGFGFPPKLFGVKKGETEYTLNALPFGGFVKIFGESPDEESLNGKDSARSFINKPKYQQALVLLAGVVMNFLLAWLLFSFSFMFGLPTSVGSERPGSTLSDVHLVLLSVNPGSPAEKSGLLVGDKVLSVKSGTDVLSKIDPDSLKNFIVSHLNKEIEIGYTRGQNPILNTAKILPIQGKIGISMDEIGISKLPVLSSLSEGMRLDLYLTQNTALGLYSLLKETLTGKGSLDSVTGPIGLVKTVGDVYQFGFAYLLSFAALISVNLSIINVIPFPALDGGRLFFLLIEKIKGSPMNPKVANTINMVGFGILIALILLISYHDVVKLF